MLQLFVPLMFAIAPALLLSFWRTIWFPLVHGPPPVPVPVKAR